MSDWDLFRTGLAEDCTADDELSVESNIGGVALEVEARLDTSALLWQAGDTSFARVTFKDGSSGYVALGYNLTGEDEMEDYEIVPIDDPVTWLKAQSADLHKQARECRDAARAALHTIGFVQLMQGDGNGQQK
jgi:hypothetical protein